MHDPVLAVVQPMLASVTRTYAPGTTEPPLFAVMVMLTGAVVVRSWVDAKVPPLAALSVTVTVVSSVDTPDLLRRSA